MAPFLYLLSTVWAAFVIPLSLMLMFVSVTASGRIFAVCACALGVCPFLFADGWLKRRFALIKAALWLGVATLPLIGFLLIAAPNGKIIKADGVRDLYSQRGVSSVSRYQLANVVPEIDQLLLGFTIMPLVDPYFTTSQSRKLKSETIRLYREMDSDGGFAKVGSSLADAYGELLVGIKYRGHAFLYIPHGVPMDGSAKLLVFLHGSGGNFKAYTWILSKLAEQQRAVLVAPSCGVGDWQEGETEHLVSAALDAVAGEVPYDKSNIHIIGLSNGGLALSYLLKNEGLRFKSCCFISPVFSQSLRSLDSPANAIQQIPVLVLSGVDDDRVPISYVNGVVTSLRNRGMSIQLEAVGGADHFLMFTHQGLVITSLDKWVSACATIK